MDEVLHNLRSLMADTEAEVDVCEREGYEWSASWEKGRRSGLRDAIELIESANLMVVPE